MIEHLLFGFATGIVVATIYGLKHKKPDFVFITVLVLGSSLLPDIDHLMNYVLMGVIGFMHNILFAIVVTVLLGFAVYKRYPDRITYGVSMAFVGIGYCSHLLADAMAYIASYPYFFPFSTTLYGIGILNYEKNVFVSIPLMPCLDVTMFCHGVILGSAQTFLVGFAMLAATIALRYVVLGTIKTKTTLTEPYNE